MKDLLILLLHLLITIAKLLGPVGAKTVVADSLFMKQQLPVIYRSRRRAPNLSALDRLLFGFWSLFLDPHRILRAAVITRPSTLLKFHSLLKQRKYRLLYSTGRKGLLSKPGIANVQENLARAAAQSDYQARRITHEQIMDPRQLANESGLFQHNSIGVAVDGGVEILDLTPSPYLFGLYQGICLRQS